LNFLKKKQKNNAVLLVFRRLPFLLCAVPFVFESFLKARGGAEKAGGRDTESPMAAVEKLEVLAHAAPDLLTRLAWARQKCSAHSSGTAPTRATLFTSKNLDKVLVTIDKKFPVMDASVEKATGYGELKSKSKVFFEELEPFYYTLVDAYQFKELAGPVLIACANATTEFSLSNNPNVTELFFDVFTAYAKIVMMVFQFEEKKRVLGTYMKLYKYVRQTDEPSYQKVAKWIVSWEALPLGNLAKEFQGVADKLGRSLQNHLLMFSRARTVATLRKEGTLNLTLKPEDCTKPVIDQFLLQIHLVPKLTEWVQWVALAAPHSLHHMADLAKIVLSDVWRAPVAGECTLDLHHELHHVCEKVKDVKDKKVARETVSLATSNGLLAHKERRVFLRQEMSQLFHLCSDQPALLRPKFPLVIAALSMARDEILVYFRHVNTVSELHGARKLAEGDTVDKRISDLIWMVRGLRDLVFKHADEIKDYYLAYLSGADSKALREQSRGDFSSAVGPHITAICNDIIEQISACQPGRYDVDFRVLRLNWARAEAAMTGAKENMPLSKIKRTVDRFNVAIYHTRIVDQFDVLMDQFSDLSQLFYFISPFFKSFAASIKEVPCQPLHTGAYLRVVADFPAVATHDADLKTVGSLSQKILDKMITELVGRVVLLLHEIAKKQIEYQGQTDPNNAMYDLLSKLPQARKKLATMKRPKTPGSESIFAKRAEVEKLRQYERNMWQLCVALQEFEHISVYHMQFTPREYLREKIGERFVKFMRSKVVYTHGEGKAQVSVLQRPSKFLEQLRVYSSVLKGCEYFLDFDVDQMLRTKVLSEMFVSPLADLPSLAWCDAEDAAFKMKDTTCGQIVAWYKGMFENQFQKPGVVWSDNRRSFVTKSGTPLVAAEGGCVEYLTDTAELRALCELGGAYLATLLEREALKFVSSEMLKIRACLHNNKATLEDFAQNYKDERKSHETLKKLKEPDVFVAAAVAIGNALAFRRLLFLALGDVTRERTPLLFDASASMFAQYRQNTFMAKELVPSDVLAHACGVSVGSAADQVLKKMIGKVVKKSDQALWDLLPTMFAVSFYAPAWKQATFRAVVDAHDNNVGVMALTASDLLVSLKALSSSSDDEKEIVNMLHQFLEVSATVLLRVGRGHLYSKVDKLTPTHFPSMVIFLDKVVDTCPLLSRDALEQVVPYSLLVSDWHQVLNVDGGLGKGKAAHSAAASAEHAAGHLGASEGPGGRAEDKF
jgi:NCK-associated protein 1